MTLLFFRPHSSTVGVECDATSQRVTVAEGEAATFLTADTSAVRKSWLRLARPTLRKGVNAGSKILIHLPYLSVRSGRCCSDAAPSFSVRDLYYNGAMSHLNTAYEFGAAQALEDFDKQAGDMFSRLDTARRQAVQRHEPAKPNVPIAASTRLREVSGPTGTTRTFSHSATPPAKKPIPVVQGPPPVGPASK
jgi:hypothetical protein